MLGGKLVMRLVVRPVIFPGGRRLRAGPGLALDITGNGAAGRGYASIQRWPLVFQDSRLPSLSSVLLPRVGFSRVGHSRVGPGKHSIGRRPGSAIRASFFGRRDRPFRPRGSPRLTAQPHRERDGRQAE
jgi:hypothetical protein